MIIVLINELKNKGKLSMFTLNCNGHLLVSDSPLVMGIINVTPDSFYKDSRRASEPEILQHVEKMIADGAAIIDVGGQSTRPGSRPISPREELERVIPCIESIKQNFPGVIISIDTYRSEVAIAAVSAGALMVNDISGGTMDKDMLVSVGMLQVPYVCMHIIGTPDTMQQHASYENVTREVLDYFIKKTEECKIAGINDVIIDPGFGFAKNIEHNFKLLRELDLLKILNRPVMVGVSRKSTIYKTLGITAEEALNGTTVLNTVALLKGANILRVHDVKEAVEAVKLVTALTTYESQK